MTWIQVVLGWNWNISLTLVHHKKIFCFEGITNPFRGHIDDILLKRLNILTSMWLNPNENKFKRKKNEDWRSLFRFNWGSTHFIRCIIDSGYNFDSWKSTKIIKSSIYQTFSFVFVFDSYFQPFWSNKTNDADLWNKKHMKQSAFVLIWRDILTVMNFFPDQNSFFCRPEKKLESSWNV